MTTLMDNAVVSRHLGQITGYASEYDPALLVKEPRSSNRQHLYIDKYNLPFCGYDVWNAYEVSCLTDKGLPVASIAKISYPCTNDYLVESKSLKLYLNSFNMTKLGDTPTEARQLVSDTMATDLSSLLETDVNVGLFSPGDSTNHNNKQYFNESYQTLEECCNVINNLQVSVYTEEPGLLLQGNIRTNNYVTAQKYHSSLLKSNCRVTKQPDWGDVYIHFEGTRIIDKQSLLKYIVSFRDECHFHEEICETIYKRLWDMYCPKKLMVSCLYTRRGGIDINPVRSSSVDLINVDMIDHNTPFLKTAKQ